MEALKYWKTLAFRPLKGKIGLLLVLNVPAKFTTLAEVAVKPPVKLRVSPTASPKVSAPVFKKLVALVIVVVVPRISKA